MLIFGGGYFQGSQLNDLRSLNNISSPTPSWSQLFPTGTAPTRRYYPASALDVLRNRWIIFGGYGGVNYNTVYTLGWDVGVSESETPTISEPVVTVTPNPFRSYATLSYEGGGQDVSSVMVFDSQGRLIRRCPLGNNRYPTKVVWDGKDDKGSEVCAGTYFFLAETSDGIILERVVKIK